MSSIEVKTFDDPDESNTNFKNAKIDIVKVGDQRVMRLVLQPGWKWSQDIKPTVGTDSCKAKHLGVIVSGAVCAKHDDGTELTYKAGAGFPSPATDYIEEDIDLNVHLIKNVPATFIIRVQGKSMVDVGINDGDLLVVDKSLAPKNFSTVIANVHDELVVKSFVQERDKKFLTSGSKDFRDRILINEEEDIFIWGVVTYVIHSVY